MTEDVTKPIAVAAFSSVGEFEALLYDNGIVEFRWDKKVEMISVNMLKNARAALFYLGHGKRMPVFVSTLDFMESEEDAKQYAASLPASEFSLAHAVLVDNLGKRLLYNAFLKLYSPAIPTKAFSKPESAYAWLLSFK